MTSQPDAVANTISGLKVLVLEDQSFQRNLLVGVLHHLGITAVESAGDGSAALDALKRTQGEFDVAICDLRMEGMDGIEFIRRAANYSVKSFIVTSAIDTSLLASAEAVLRSYNTRLLGVLPKPVNIDSLKGMLVDCKKAEAQEATGSASAVKVVHTTSEIREGLTKDQFIPYFQPKFCLETGMPSGVEMLARWAHPVFGILSPAAFVPAMEEAGLIDALSDSLFSHALKCAREWSQIGCDIGMAINLSPLTLQNTDMPNQIGSLVRRYGIAPGRITIEVTETAVSQNVSGLMESLTRLRMQGFAISVDDFGTGYSSLLQLSEMPFTEIKIDRNFVSGATENRKTTLIAESIVDLAKKLDLHTVAEGVETRAELDFIRKLGCETGQGYFLAKPMNQMDLMKFLASARRPG
ncbi:EAL domain-containing protein [Herbaspirillum sp. GCM10030257]|uniref:EAL domain-containing response regulator n=1 Tax=Herbaspirillum sp. GCM10030257 TaxID=3273393 RepID=UPI0036187535